MILDGKVLAVTGGSQGIGKAVAEEALKQGARVVVNDVDAELLGRTVDEMGSGEKIEAVPGDVSEMATARKIASAAVERFGRLDAIVNNAGVLRDRTFLKMSEDEWDLVIRVHLRGTFCCAKAAAEVMAEKGGGSIVNVTSTAGMKGNFGQCNYSAAKSAILGFTRTLSMELKKQNIRVNAIAPGAKTRMTLSIPEEVLMQKAKDDPKYLKLLNLPGPECVAPLVCFLASEKAVDINGMIFGIVGGELSLWRYPGQVKVMYTEGKWSDEQLEKAIPRLVEELK
ncbi:MAG: SDR family NAD(P)-dependent oxidoreductase [bacterium]